MPIRDPEKRRAYQREWVRRRRGELLAGELCLRCGATDNLELHHLVKNEKSTHRITTWARERADAEKRLCVVLCGRCHDELHASEKRKPCGTSAAYDHRGCRCDACRAAKAEYRRRRKQTA